MSGPVIPSVAVGDVPIRRWARTALRRSKRRLQRPECVLAVRAVAYRGWSFPLPAPWDNATFCVDGRMVGMTQAPPDQEFAVGLTAGWHTFSAEPLEAKHVIRPVTLEIGRGEIVLIEGRTGYFDVRAESPTMTIRALPSGFARSGRWGRRWARYLGWADETSAQGPVPEDANDHAVATSGAAKADGAVGAFLDRLVAEAHRQGVEASVGRGRGGAAQRLDVIAGGNVLMFWCGGDGVLRVEASVMPESAPGRRVNTRSIDLPRGEAGIDPLVALLAGEGVVKHRWVTNDELIVGQRLATLALPLASRRTADGRA